MKTKEAQKLKTELQEFCRKNGLWFEVHEVNKPDLKDIVVTVSIRISEK